MRKIPSKTSPNPAFIRFPLPVGPAAWIPGDIELRLPESSRLDPADWHFLVIIPWRQRYLGQVPPAYRDFFQAALPYLRVRTTDVHVATCLPFIGELSRAEDEPVDERVVSLAFILHDSGWSRLDEQAIAHSLGIRGLHLYGDSIQPKLQHALFGEQIARELLGSYPFDPHLTDDQKEQVYQAVLYHDRPRELAASGGIPVNLRVVCNVDHLWSFTHPNFWQDTVRKGVPADLYLSNLEKDLDQYFVSEPGRVKARQLLEQRAMEVEAWKEWVKAHPL
jgi:hypothetical protein